VDDRRAPRRRRPRHRPPDAAVRGRPDRAGGGRRALGDRPAARGRDTAGVEGAARRSDHPELDATGEQLPDLGPAFRANRPADAGQAAAFDRLEAALDEELRRAGTHAFSRSFLVAAALALAALVPIALARERIPL
jgi:hypothetical protein